MTDKPKDKPQACSSSTEPGVICIGKVDGVPNKKCVQPIQPKSGQCPAGLLQFLAQVVNVASASPKDTCQAVPCCDLKGSPTTCATVAVGCIADVKVCVGGAVGNLLDAILGPLDLQLLQRTLPIKVLSPGGGSVGGIDVGGIVGDILG